MSKVELSVIIPTHKRRDLLFYELNHIYMQKEVEFEVIVVNDIKESDETDEIISRYPHIIYIKDSTIQGPSNKHKAGYRIAKGDYLYMPDDDDYLVDKYFFRKAIDRLLSDPKLAFVSGQCKKRKEFFDCNKNIIEDYQTKVRGRISGPEYLQEFQHKLDKPLSTVSTIYRKRAFDETDAANMIEMSDSSIYMQCLLWGDAYIMDDVVAVYRVQERSLTTTASYAFMINVMKQKELIYKKSIGYLMNPRDFWAQQFIITYIFWPNKQTTEKIKCLIWALLHCHFSLRMLKFIIKEVIKY